MVIRRHRPQSPSFLWNDCFAMFKVRVAGNVQNIDSLARVSGRVVVVVVRELFYLVTSAICVRIRGQRLRRLFTT